MFEEMVGWAVDEGVDYIIGETFYYAEEAFCALDVIKQTGLPAVVTIAPMAENIMRDNWQNNIRYLGVCCGAAPMHIREVAEAMGRKPLASRYSENMKKHFLYGNDQRLPTHITEYGDKA